MRRTSGYADGLISGATWGLVAVILAPVSARLSGHPAAATALVVGAVFDAAAAAWLILRATATSSARAIVRLLGSRGALTVALCSLLGGPLFMGGYLVGVVLAGPSFALTATATYPVFGTLLALGTLGQHLNRTGWVGVVATGLGAALTTFEASSAEHSARTLLGVGIALLAAAALALEGVVATRAMVEADADTVMAVRELFSAVQFTAIFLVIPGGLSTAAVVLTHASLGVPVVIAGAIGGYSFAIWYHSINKIGVARAMALNITYAMWGSVFAWTLHQIRFSASELLGCLVVTLGAVLTIMSRDRPRERVTG